MRSGSRDGTSAERWRSSGAHDVVKRSPCRAARAETEFIEFLWAGSRLHQRGGANMFEEIFFPRTAEKYRAAPLVEQRERYLVHLRGPAHSKHLAKMRQRSAEPRPASESAGRRPGEQSPVEAAATNWSRPKGRRCNRSASPKASSRFVGHGIDGCPFWAGSTNPNVSPPSAPSRDPRLRELAAPRTRSLHGDHPRLLPRRRPLLLLVGGKGRSPECRPDDRHRRCHRGGAQTVALGAAVRSTITRSV